MDLAEDLRRAVRAAGEAGARVRALVVGVGNSARADDGVGPAVVEELRGSGVKALDAGDAPERCLGPIAQSGAQVVVFVDAVDFGGKAGEAVLLQAPDLPQRSCVTHRSALSLVMRYIREQAGQQSLLIGVQPGSTEFGRGMTPRVEAAVKAIAAAISAALAARGRGVRQKPA